MIKECPVIINNEAVSVVNFDGIDIQFPSLGKNVKKVNVKFEDGNYSIVKDEIKVSKPVEKEAETVKEEKPIEVEKKQKKTTRKKRETVDE